MRAFTILALFGSTIVSGYAISTRVDEATGGTSVFDSTFTLDPRALVQGEHGNGAPIIEALEKRARRIEIDARGTRGASMGGGRWGERSVDVDIEERGTRGASMGAGRWGKRSADADIEERGTRGASMGAGRWGERSVDVDIEERGTRGASMGAGRWGKRSAEGDEPVA